MKNLVPLAATLSLFVCATHAASLSTTFTYQGRLTDNGQPDNGQPANGSYDLTFQLFDAATNGAPVGVTVTNTSIEVANGLFTTSLDFGANVFDGNARWLEISAKTNGATAFTMLSPRQLLTPTPYALFAPNAAVATTANGVAANVVTPTQLNTPGAPSNGQVLAYNGTSLIWTNASTVASAWSLNGNAETTPSVNFLGTADSQPLELRANGQRALRLEPNVGSAPNVIGGSPINVVDARVVGATIAGGGSSNFFDGIGFLTDTNRIASNFGTIGGGAGNEIQNNATYATIGGGWRNTIRASFVPRSVSTIGGGWENKIEADSYGSTIGGGVGNTIQANSYNATIGGGGNTIEANAGSSTIAGGSNNRIQVRSFNSSIGGGIGNTIQSNANTSTIGGGGGNAILANAKLSTIGGGWDNRIQGSEGAFATVATIGGGSNNAIQTNAVGSTISGGQMNVIGTNAAFAVISGGASNVVSDARETIGGGALNTIQSDAEDSTIAGGLNNTIQANASSATIGGGGANAIQTNAFSATIGGGSFNTIQADASRATIGGGQQNTIQSNTFAGTIGGGFGNKVNASDATIAGGVNSTIQINADGATICGGFNNTIRSNALAAIIAGGGFNSATNYAFAAGNRAKADHTGAFVWADSSDFDFPSTATNEFAVRATGGVRLVSGIDTNGAPVAGVSLSAGGGSWSSLSDRNAKENLRPVNGRVVLEKVSALPLATWNYISQDTAVRHIGPMAQDFRAAFGVGENDTTITTIDADGVALAAIQGLNEKLEEKDARIGALEREISELKRAVKKLSERKN
jgi:hypothetical protein